MNTRMVLTVFLAFLIIFSCTKTNDSKKKLNKSVNSYSDLRKEELYIKLKKEMKSLNYKKARKTLELLSIKYPKNAELYYILAIITKNTNPDPLKSIDILKVSLSLDDKFASAWKLLGDLYYIRKEYKNAIKSWEMAIDQIKNDANLYYRLGYLYYTIKDFKNAVKYFKKSIQLDKNFEWNYYYLGEIYFSDFKKPQEGIKYIEQGLKLLPKNKDLNQKLALFYYDTKNYKKAIEQNKKVLDIVEYDNFAIENISDAYMQMKNYDKAALWLDKILKEQPRSIYYIKKMSDIMIIKKDFKKATELLNLSLKLENDADVKSKLAKLYLAMGDKKKYQEIVKDLKDSDDPASSRAAVYLKLEQQAKELEKKEKKQSKSQTK